MNVLLLLPSILLMLLEGVSPSSPPSSAAQHGPGAASAHESNSTSLRSTEQAAPRQGVRPIFESMRRGLSGSSNSSGKTEAPNTSSIAGSSYGWSSAYRRSNGGEEVVDDQKEMNKDLKKLIQEMEEGDVETWEKFRSKLSREQLLQRQREGGDSGTASSPYSFEEEAATTTAAAAEDDSMQVARDGAWYWEQQQRQARSALLTSSDHNREKSDRSNSDSSDGRIRARRGPTIPNPFNRSSKRNGAPRSLPKQQQQLSAEEAAAAASINYFSDEKFDWRQLAADDILSDLDPHKFVTFKSVVKLSAFFVVASVLSYLSVVPSSLPLLEYNLEYKNTLLRVFGSAMWPVVLLALIYRSEDANINAVVDQFVRSVFLDYPVLCLLEVVAVTAIRLGVLRLFEPQVFTLCEKIPSIFLPWRMTLYDYYPSGLTLSIFLSVSNILTSPLIEEVFKASLLSGAINRIRHRRRRGSGAGKRLPKAAEAQHAAVMLDADDHPITLRTYLIFMLAGAVGLKVADNIRRVLLYAQPLQRHKTFFAVARGFYPVHELCGAMTALALSRRDILGHKMSFFSAVFPAVFLHGMANARGKRPVYVWGSRRPWDEIQLQAWNAADHSAPQQLLFAGAMNLLWYLVFVRAFFTVLFQYVISIREYILKFNSGNRDSSSGSYSNNQMF